MRVFLALIVVLFGGLALAIHRFRTRTMRAASAKAASRVEQAARLREGRRTAETEYVLSQIDRNLERVRGEESPDHRRLARLEELKDVLSQTLKSREVPFPVSGPCAEVIESLRDEAGERELLYSESGDGRWLHVLGDRALFRWAVRELCVNTFQHAGAFSRIAILAEPFEGGIVLSVRDDGQGLDPALSARLYSPFTPRAGSLGPGLGLYVVRRVVETAGGTIEVRSAPGQGLLHRLRLPSPAGDPYGAASSTGRKQEESRL